MQAIIGYYGIYTRINLIQLVNLLLAHSCQYKVATYEKCAISCYHDYFLIPIALVMRQANTVNTIFGLTSTKSSGRA